MEIFAAIIFVLLLVVLIVGKLIIRNRSNSSSNSSVPSDTKSNGTPISAKSNPREYTASILPDVFLVFEIIVLIAGIIAFIFGIAEKNSILIWSSAVSTIASIFSLAVLRSLFLKLNSIGEILNDLQNK